MAIIGLDIDTKDVTLVHVMHRREKDIRVDFFFEVKNYKGTPCNNEPDKCDDVSWFPIDNLPTNTIPYIKKAITNSLEKKIYSEMGWSAMVKLNDANASS